MVYYFVLFQVIRTFLFCWGQGDEALDKDSFVCYQSFLFTKYMFFQLHLVVVNVNGALSIFFKEFFCDIYFLSTICTVYNIDAYFQASPTQ